MVLLQTLAGQQQVSQSTDILGGQIWLRDVRRWHRRAFHQPAQTPRQPRISAMQSLLQPQRRVPPSSQRPSSCGRHKVQSRLLRRSATSGRHG